MSAKKRFNKLSGIFLIVGVLLMLLAAAYGVYTVVSSKNANADNEKLVAMAEKLLPPIKDAFPEERGNSTMPSMELDGVNVLGIIEMPLHDCRLPVGTAWSAKSAQNMPCRYDGNVYDGSLMIGTVDTDGQFDFAADVSVEETVVFIDMEGGRYSYKVSSIKRSTDFKGEEWADEKADLTVFVKNTFSGEYTVIYCVVKGVAANA